MNLTLKKLEKMYLLGMWNKKEKNTECAGRLKLNWVRTKKECRCRAARLFTNSFFKGT